MPLFTELHCQFHLEKSDADAAAYVTVGKELQVAPIATVIDVGLITRVDEAPDSVEHEDEVYRAKACVEDEGARLVESHVTEDVLDCHAHVELIPDAVPALYKLNKNCLESMY